MKATIEIIISSATRGRTNTMKTMRMFQHKYEAVCFFNKMVADWTKGYSTPLCSDDNIVEASFECAENGYKETITIKIE